MKSGREQVEIIALYEELASYRAVAALVGCDHKPVKRRVELARAPGQRAPPRRRVRVADEFREQVERTPARITVRQPDGNHPKSLTPGGAARGRPERAHQ